MIAALRRIKPLHGWRVFWGEVGIIVLGVLIALVIGEAAGRWNKRNDARDAEQAIRREIESNLGMLASRRGVQPCIDRRLDEIAAILDRAAAGRPFAPPGWIGRPQLWAFPHTMFDAASQAGQVALLGRDRQYVFSTYYAAFALAFEAQVKEQDAWARLRALEGATKLPEALAVALRLSLQDARLSNWKINMVAQDAVASSAQDGFHPDDDRQGSRAMCLPFGATRAEITRANYGFPEP